MLNAWVEHRKHTLHECRNLLSVLQSETVDKEDVDTYILHCVNVKVLENRIQDLVDSREGTMWSPELTLSKLEEAMDEVNIYTKQLDKINEKIKHYGQCLETFKHISKIQFSRLCDTLKNYSDVNFLPTKMKQMTNGDLMKYMSGGEYEQESLRVYVAFQRFIKEHLLWYCNVSIFDEPGTAMSTNALQKFVDGLQQEKCNIVITHKPILCNKEIILN